MTNINFAALVMRIHSFLFSMLHMLQLLWYGYLFETLVSGTYGRYTTI